MRKGIVRLIVSLFYSFLGLSLLILISCGGGGSSDTQPTTNHAPVAFAGSNQNVLTGSLVTLDGTGSYDVDGDPLTYSWALTDVPAGSTAVLSDATSSRPTFVPTVSGNYVARLIVNDGKAESTGATVTITASVFPSPSAGDNQLWKFETVEGTYAGDNPNRIVAKHSGKVLDVAGGSKELGTQVNQYTYNGGDHQKFYLDDYSSLKGIAGLYEIRVKHTLYDAYRRVYKLCLDVENGSLADNAKVQQQLCGYGSSASKLWYVTDNGNGYYKIKNYNSGKCMDVADASLADGANVQQYTCK